MSSIWTSLFNHAMFKVNLRWPYTLPIDKYSVQNTCTVWLNMKYLSLSRTDYTYFCVQNRHDVFFGRSNILRITNNFNMWIWKIKWQNVPNILWITNYFKMWIWKIKLQNVPNILRITNYCNMWIWKTKLQNAHVNYSLEMKLVWRSIICLGSK